MKLKFRPCRSSTSAYTIIPNVIFARDYNLSPNELGILCYLYVNSEIAISGGIIGQMESRFSNLSMDEIYKCLSNLQHKDFIKWTEGKIYLVK